MLKILRTETQKPHIALFHLHEMPQIGKFLERKRRLVVARFWEGIWSVTTNGHGLSFGSNKSVLELVVTVVQPCEYM